MNKALSPAELQATVVDIPKPTRKRRKPLLVGAALIAIAGAAWYGFEWWQANRFLVTTDDAYVGGNVTPLAPRVAGHIDQVLVEDNQHVSVGQPVIRIDDRPFKAQLPCYVKNMLVNTYRNYTITRAAGILQDRRKIWIVKLANETNYIAARIEGGDLDEIENFRKANSSFPLII